MLKEMRSLCNHKRRNKEMKQWRNEEKEEMKQWRNEEKEEVKKRRNEEKEACSVQDVILLKKITKQWERCFISQWIS